MTGGYADYVPNADFVQAFYQDPFRQWSPADLIAFSTASPHRFEPGTKWDYSHTNYVILGQALESITGQSLATLLQEKILDPLDLRNTIGSSTAAIPEPVLHAFSSERRDALGIPADARFYEESTFWNPSWTLPAGAIQTTNIYDMTATAVAVGTGALLSPDTHRLQIEPSLLGFPTLMGCPNCFSLDHRYSYGLGVVISGSWLLQNPLFGGYSAVEAYLPSREIAIAVATTFGEQSFDEIGNLKYGNVSDRLFREIAAILAPDDSPPRHD